MHIEVQNINGFVIELPIGIAQVMETKVRDSYQDFLQKDTTLVRRHLTALTTLLPKYLQTTMKKVLHVFGGVGATAQVIDQTIPGVEHIFWERDPLLVDYLRTRYPVNNVQYVPNSFDKLPMTSLVEYDAIMFDPSVATIKTPHIKDCWRAMAEAQPQLIWLSDTACAKIHLNAKFYETDFGTAVDPTAEGYLEAYNMWLMTKFGYRISDAMREAAETYCIVEPGTGGWFPQPIPYM